MAVGSVASAGNLILALLALRQSIEQEKQVVEIVKQATRQVKAAAPSVPSGRGTILDIIA